MITRTKIHSMHSTCIAWVFASTIIYAGGLQANICPSQPPSSLPKLGLSLPWQKRLGTHAFFRTHGTGMSTPASFGNLWCDDSCDNSMRICPVEYSLKLNLGMALLPFAWGITVPLWSLYSYTKLVIKNWEQRYVKQKYPELLLHSFSYPVKFPIAKSDLHRGELKN